MATTVAVAVTEAQKIIDRIKQGSVDPASIMAIVKDASKTSDPVQVLTMIAAGPDGVLGTSDDIIPPETIAKLRTLVDSDIAKDIVSYIETSGILGTVKSAAGRLGCCGV